MAAVAKEHVWVRIKPYNERRHQLLRRFSIYGMRFEEARGWYIVPSEIELANGKVVNLAEVLRNKRVDNEDANSPLAMDVMTEQEAKSLDEAQRKEAEERKAALDANRVLPPPDLSPAEGEEQDVVHRRSSRSRSRKTSTPGV
jgi:hypothetical protein